MFKRKVQRIKNTLLAVIPQGICEVLKIQKGDTLVYYLDGNRVVIEKLYGMR